MTPIEVRRYKDVVAIKRSERIIGFHARNLQVADLDLAAWQAFHHNTPETSEAREELEFWHNQNDAEVVDSYTPQVATTLVVNITQICNLKCTYCAAGGDGSYGDKKGKVDVSIIEPQIRQRLSQLKPGQTLHLHFFGGEPLLHPEAIRKLSAYAKLAAVGTGVDVKFNITTNGTLITPAIADLLASIRCNVNLSLDGPAELNDHRRPDAQGRPSTERAVQGLKNLLQRRQDLGTLAVTAVFGKHNLSVVKAYEFFSQFDFDAINLSYEIGKEADTASLKIYLSQFAEVLKLAKQKGERELRKIISVDHYFSTLDNGVRTLNHCGAGKNLIHSDVRGSLYACGWLINDKSESLGEASSPNLDALKAYEDPLVEKNNCGQCWARFVCGGGCMVANKTKNNNKHEKDFEFCTRTRTQIALTLMEYADLRKETV